MSDIDEIITKITGTIAEIKQTRQKCLDRIELDTLTVRQCDEDLKKILDAIVGAKPIGRPRDDGFAQSGPDGYIKIGVTGRGSKSRISDNTMNPYPITLLAEMEGDETTEAALHKLFEHLRIKGEWFKPSQDLLDYIASVKKGNPTVVANLSEITPDAGCSWSCRATVGALVSALKNEKAENADLARERRRAVQGVGSLLREIETIHRALFKRALFGLDDKGFEGFEGILDDGVAWKRLCDLGAYPYTLRERLLSPRWEDPVV